MYPSDDRLCLAAYRLRLNVEPMNDKASAVFMGSSSAKSEQRRILHTSAALVGGTRLALLRKRRAKPSVVVGTLFEYANLIVPLLVVAPPVHTAGHLCVVENNVQGIRSP